VKRGLGYKKLGRGVLLSSAINQAPETRGSHLSIPIRMRTNKDVKVTILTVQGSELQKSLRYGKV